MIGSRMSGEEVFGRNSPFRHSIDKNGDVNPLADEQEFRSSDLFKYVDPSEYLASPRRNQDVCVIGGGIAGLTAAYELDRLGNSVTIVERSGKWGGRILTHRFNDGCYGELGPMRIPDDHECVNHYIRELRLSTREFVSENNAAYVYLRGSKYTRDDWRKFGDNYDVPILKKISARGAPPGQLSISPMEIEGKFQSHTIDIMTSKQKQEMFANILTTQKLLDLDGRTVRQAFFDFCNEYYLPEYKARYHGDITADEMNDVWEFVGRATNIIWLEHISFLHFLRENTALQAKGKIEIEGGMDLLTAAFVTALENSQSVSMHKDKRVVSVRIEEEGVLVGWVDDQGKRTEKQFDKIICTVPAKSVLAIEFSPALDWVQKEALESVSYLGAAKVLIHCKERFWELQDGIFGGASITDMPVQQVWYPSDNSDPVESEGGGDGRITGNSLDRADIQDQQIASRKARDEEVSRQPGVLVASYMWGRSARRFASLTDGEREELALSCIEELHPGAESYVTEIVPWSWDRQNNPGGGAFAWFQPAEHQRYQDALCRPIDGQNGRRVFFAGEHLGLIQGWIQSAMQTAIAAVIEASQP